MFQWPSSNACTESASSSPSQRGVVPPQTTGCHSPAGTTSGVTTSADRKPSSASRLKPLKGTARWSSSCDRRSTWSSSRVAGAVMGVSGGVRIADLHGTRGGSHGGCYGGRYSHPDHECRRQKKGATEKSRPRRESFFSPASQACLLDLELAGLHDRTVARYFELVLAQRPAIGLAHAELGDLRTRGDRLVLGVDDLVAERPLGGEVAGGAVAGDGGVDGVALGEGRRRCGDAVVGADRVAQVDHGDGRGGRRCRRGLGWHRCGCRRRLGGGRRDG